MKTSVLLQDLTARTAAINEVANELLQIPLAMLNYKPDETKWSALQCIEHLNKYSSYYLREIERALRACGHAFVETEMTYSWIGNYSIKMMHPLSIKKQKTFRKMEPSKSELSYDVLRNFLSHQEKLVELIKRCMSLNITQGKVAVEFFKVLKMNVGESLEFVITHQERHVLQIQRLIPNKELSGNAVVLLK